MLTEKENYPNPEFLASFPIRVIIYDLDGLLVDTEELWFETCKRVLKFYGVEVQEEHRLELAGRGKLSAFFVERFGVQDTLEVISKKIWNTFYELAETGLKPIPGAIDSVQRFSPYFLQAVASSAHTNYIEMAVDQLGLRDHFRALVGSDQVERAKPDPLVFLRTAELVGVEPGQCLVLEDSVNGIEAAKAAGMLCIVVPNRYLQNADFSAADLNIPTLEVLDFDVLRELVDSKHLHN